MLKDEVVKVLKEHLIKEPKVSMTFLFGSIVNDSMRKDSDIDIALFFKEPYSWNDLANIRTKISSLFSYPTDILVLNNAGPTIAMVAIKGIPIIIKDEAFYMQYMLKISREAEDFLQFIFDLWKWREKMKSYVTT